MKIQESRLSVMYTQRDLTMDERRLGMTIWLSSFLLCLGLFSRFPLKFLQDSSRITSNNVVGRNVLFILASTQNGRERSSPL